MLRLRFSHASVSATVLILYLWMTACQTPTPQPDFYPKSKDDRLKVDLIAEQPDIVTPIGLTIDSHDALYVLESHTHSPPKDYKGPAYDRIKKGIDQDNDGIPESWIVFADSIEDGMNIFCGPNDEIYVTEKDRVWEILDTDLDGVSEERTLLLDMVEPENVYDHAGILGVTFHDGWLYVSRGNTGGQGWKIIGTDGSTISGYGDGGNVMRCKADGTQLEEIATGFWNPFDIKFSQSDRLLVVDNDPDSRGPNRLIEVVPGGDYGYQSLYGGSGIHPFLAWNGELPGTLPYAAALGEAPSGLIDASFTQLPSDYQGNILCTIWEENTLVYVPLQSYQSTVKGEAHILLQGDSTFHPVALAANSKGDLYITDWVVRQYPNHGKGRIWRLTTKESDTALPQLVKNDFEESYGNPYLKMYEDTTLNKALFEALGKDDPYLQTVARKGLQRPSHSDQLLTLLASQDPNLRLQALLTLSHMDRSISQDRLNTLLYDQHVAIRRMTLQYIARHMRADMVKDVKDALYRSIITPELFETYLATIRHLQPSFIQAYKDQSERYSKELERVLPADYIISLVKDNRLSADIRAAALPYLPDPKSYLNDLIEMLPESEPAFQESIIHAIKKIDDEQVAQHILNLVLDNTTPTTLRVQSMVALTYQSTNLHNAVNNLFEKDIDPLLAEKAIRYLCRYREEDEVKKAVKTYLEKQPQHQRATQIWDLCTGNTTNESRPRSDQEWTRVVDNSGDAQSGKWVFQSLQAQCTNCHQVAGWGGVLGPDLSNVGSSKSQTQLITAILNPSEEISPEWQGWFVKTRNGKIHTGRQIDVGYSNVELMNLSGEFITYKDPLDFGLAPQSLMPDGLENALTPHEFNDLIAYLMSLQ